METDREVLIWLHERLRQRYAEDELQDFMHRLRWIIVATPPRKVSRGQKVRMTCNGIKYLRKLLPRLTEREVRWLKEAESEP